MKVLNGPAAVEADGENNLAKAKRENAKNNGAGASFYTKYKQGENDYGLKVLCCYIYWYHFKSKCLGDRGGDGGMSVLNIMRMPL